MKRDFAMQTVEIANQDAAERTATPDTLFGICYSVGKDFGFNPFYLRVALIVLAVFSIPASVATYVGLGLAVGLSRMFFPAQQAEVAEKPELPVVQPKVAEQVREQELVAA